MLSKCRACDSMLIYPCEIYYYEEQGYDSLQVPAGRAFSRAVMDEKSLSLLFQVGGWGGAVAAPAFKSQPI